MMKNTMMMMAMMTVATGCAAPMMTQPAIERVDAAVATTPSPHVETMAGATCVTLQRGTAEVMDTRIAANWPDRSYGGEPVAFTGKVGGGERSMLLRFDLSSLPADASIQRATLVLYRTVPSDQDVDVVEATAKWDEMTSYKTFGQRYGRRIGTVKARNEGPGHVTADVTTLARSWHKGENHGVALRQRDGNSGYATSEAEASMRPRLEVCYAR